MEDRELLTEMLDYFDTVNEHYVQLVQKIPGKITIGKEDLAFMKSFAKQTWDIFAPNEEWPDDAIGQYKDCFLYMETEVK